MADTPMRAGVAGTYLQTISYTYGGSPSLAYGGMTSGWFGPGAPMASVVPSEVAGRTYDYPVGFNLSTQPRAYTPIGFNDLRALADGYDLLSLVIETRKDQVARMSWSIGSRNAKAKDENDPRVAQLTSFFRKPDGWRNWADWLRPVLDDLFVIDAPALYMQRDDRGRLISLIQVDGATIKPVIDNFGRTPQPYTAGGVTYYPPAYQQILKGLPLDYSTRDLLYRPRNIRAHSPYGRSPVEQITTTINIALRRQLSQLSYFTEGNIPDMLVQVPKEWTPDQIVAYQKHFDAYFTGDLGRRRRVKFTPGMGGSGAVYETRQVDLKGEFDDWLSKIVCFAFSVSPQALQKMMNRSSAETSKTLAQEEGLEPILLWVKALIDDVIETEFGAADLEFRWDSDDDQSALLSFVTGLVSKGLMTLDEGRQRLGFDPYATSYSAQPMVLTQSGYVSAAPVPPKAAASGGDEEEATAATASDDDVKSLFDPTAVEGG